MNPGPFTPAAPPRPTWLGAGAVLVMFALATAAGLAMAPRWESFPVVLVYLPPVLAAAAFAGRWLALLAAVAATLAYNFFFTEPYYTLLVHDTGDIVTVAMLLLVALVTSHLVTSLKAQGEIAAFHAGRNATIAGSRGGCCPARMKWRLQRSRRGNWRGSSIAMPAWSAAWGRFG